MVERKSKKSSESGSAPIAFSMADIKELFILMKENDIAELNIEQGETRIHIVGAPARQAPAAPVPSVVPVLPSVPPVSMVPTAPVSAPGTPVESSPPQQPEAETEKEKAPTPEIPANVKKITSPIVGTFYRAPAPDAPPFVEVGDRVKEDTTLCIIEAMKIMNEIKAEMRGKVVKILVENGMPVEYNQPLFLIEPE